MGVDTKIEWCDKTFNPWIGCTKVSPGCANCYAERQDKHRKWTPEGWGEGKPRKRTSVANWKQVERWNRQADPSPAGRCGPFKRRPRVFVGSLMDWLDPEVPIEWLADLLDLIRRCPHLDFLLLTKRPELWKERIDRVISSKNGRNYKTAWLSWWINNVEIPSNVWIGTTVEDQKRADERIPALLKIPAKVRFLSCEPLLEELDLSASIGVALNITGERCYHFNAGIHQVICGGESGPKARPMHPDWARSLRDQCQAAGVAFFMKQGSQNNWENFKDIKSFPHDLQIREFPNGI